MGHESVQDCAVHDHPVEASAQSVRFVDVNRAMVLERGQKVPIDIRGDRIDATPLRTFYD